MIVTYTFLLEVGSSKGALELPNLKKSISKDSYYASKKSISKDSYYASIWLGVGLRIGY